MYTASAGVYGNRLDVPRGSERGAPAHTATNYANKSTNTQTVSARHRRIETERPIVAGKAPGKNPVAHVARRAGAGYFRGRF